jgi:hypothetical protein
MDFSGVATSPRGAVRAKKITTAATSDVAAKP